MSKHNKTTTSFIKLKLRGTNGVTYRDIPIDKLAHQSVEEIALYETETSEVLVQKVVIGMVSELKAVE